MMVIPPTPSPGKAETGSAKVVGQRTEAVGEVPLPEDAFPLLERILHDSADQSWRMLEEGLRVEEARGEATAAGARRYPSVSGTFRYLGRIEDREDFDGSRSFYQPQAALTARQPLYHWGAVQAQDRIGRLRQAIAEGNRTEAYRVLTLAIRSAFLELAVQQKSIELAEQREALAGHELSIAKARFEREEITSEALRTTELAAAEARLALQRARRQREIAIRDFSRLSGFEPVGEEWVPAEIPLLAFTCERGIPAALDKGRSDVLVALKCDREVASTEGMPAVFDKGRSDVPVALKCGREVASTGSVAPVRPWEEVSRLRIRQAEEQLTVESARRRPRLDLVAGVAQDQVAVLNRSDIDRIVYFAGLELTWNLFDGYETQGRRRATLARKRLEAQRHERQEREWAAELERLEEEAAWTARELALAEERLELAGQTLSQREEDLSRGRISEAEMAAARVAHAEQELRANGRRAEYLMALAEWVSQAGLDPAMLHYSSRQQ